MKRWTLEPTTVADAVFHVGSGVWRVKPRVLQKGGDVAAAAAAGLGALVTGLEPPAEGPDRGGSCLGKTRQHRSRVWSDLRDLTGRTSAIMPA